VLLHIVVRTKMCLFENKNCLFVPCYFSFVASMFVSPSCVCVLTSWAYENDVERRESFSLRQTHFNVNNDMQQHENVLT
jgi:hypothetical protein